MAEPIRILQVIGIMNRGGAEAMIMNLYRHIDKEKIQFDFVEHTAESAAFDEEIISMGGKIYHCPKYIGTNHFQYCQWWNNFFSEHASEYSVVHGHIGSTAAIYLKIAKNYGLYTIVHSHSTKGKIGIKNLLYRCMSYPTRFISDYFFACSKQACIDRYGKKVSRDSSKHKILNNAIDTKTYKYDFKTRNESRKEFVLDNEIVIGHVGRFVIEKNHEFLVEVFRKILNNNKNVKLLLVGDGPLKKDVLQQVEEMGIKDNVIFAGIRSDVNRMLQRMDIFVMPSLFEGLPVSLVEAQATGLPCVISDTIPEDCHITDLVSTLKLQDSTELWAEHILNRAKEIRKDYSPEIQKAGFDITETSKWLEEFYIEHSRESKTDSLYASIQ